MKRKSRTPQRPLFETTRPLTNKWRWEVSLDVGSSGYVYKVHVKANCMFKEDPVEGHAWCKVALGDDVSEVMECLAIESMLSALEPSLEGPTCKKVEFKSNLGPG